MRCRLWLRRDARAGDIMMTHADYSKATRLALLSLHGILAHGKCSVLLLLLLRLQRCLHAKHPRVSWSPSTSPPHSTAAWTF